MYTIAWTGEDHRIRKRIRSRGVKKIHLNPIKARELMQESARERRGGSKARRRNNWILIYAYPFALASHPQPRNLQRDGTRKKKL